jgi:hypothetical protein
MKKQMEEWLKSHPRATLEEAWLAGYWTCTDNWCQKRR